MASPITVIKSRGIDTTGDYVVNSISSTGNVSAGNIKSDHLLYANGTPYAFTSNAAGTNTQVQFNDANNFAGSANLTFNKTTGTLTANFFVGDGSQLTGLPASYTDTNANSAIDARVTKSFIDNLNVDADTLDGLSSLDFATAAQGTKADTALQAADLSGYATESYVGNAVANLVNSAPALLDTLGELANAIGNDASFTTTITNQLANKADTADLSTVALTGNYADLNNKPTLFDGTYANLTGKPSLFDGEYASLANKPTLFSGSYLDLTNTPTLFDGTYANLTGKPSFATVATSGSYTDLIDKPSLFDGEYASLANKPALFDGTYANLTGLPTLFDGEYSSLANKPSLFDGTYANLTGKPTLGTAAATDANAYATAAQGTKADTALQSADLAGYATETYVTNAIANIPNPASVTVSSTAPASPIEGDLWLDSDTGEMSIYFGNAWVAPTTSVSTALTVTANAQPNITSVGTLTGLTVDGNVTANYFIGNGSQLTGMYSNTNANAAIDARVTKSFVDNLSVVANVANVAYSVSGSNVSGQVSNALVAGTVYTNAQPNITSVGTLTGLTVTGLLTATGTGVKTANIVDTSGTIAISTRYNNVPGAIGIANDLTAPGNITANYFIGDGSQLTGLPVSYTDTNANAAIDARVTKTFVDNLGVNASTLNGHSDTYFATSTQGSLADSAVQPGDLATVATSGSYNDLLNTPTLFDGTYANLTGKPTLFDGEYASLANKPALFDGTYANLTGKPTLGTAAATNANAYATAAQGLLADSAIQSGANISVFTNDSGYLVAANLSGYATETYVGTQISNLVDAAPATLNTLNELAAALGDDANFATTIANSIGNKLSTSDFTTTADTWLGTKSTTDLAEGTNLYYTTTRANSAIDARVTKTFVDNLSVVANVANVAYSVAVANVSGIGNIATLNLNGNASTILYGNGTFAAAPVTYNDSNVATYLPNYTGNLTPGNIIISSDNLKLSGGTANYVLSTDGTGNLSWVQQAAGGTSEYTVTSVDAFTGNGIDTVFTLSVAPQNINQTFINYNGALQLRSSYTLSGQDITFSEAPANGSVIEITTQMGVTSGSGSLTVRNYTATGSQTDFAVSAGVNATNILVTENGLLQTPAVDYTVTGSTLTFTTAPGNGVKVQIRELGVAVATITPAGANTQVLFNDAGSFGNSSNFTFNKTTNTLSVSNLSVTGNIIPTANVTYDLGTPTNRFKDLYLSGTTIDLGGATMTTDATTGTIALVAAPSVTNPNPTALVITSSGATLAANTTGGNINFAEVANTLANTTGFSGSYNDLTNKPSKFITIAQPGNITTPFAGVSRCYPTTNIVITNVYASLGTPASDSFSFELLKNNTSVGTYSFSSGSYRMTTTSANISVTTSDYLTLNVTAGTGATDLKVDFEYMSQ